MSNMWPRLGTTNPTRADHDPAPIPPTRPVCSLGYAIALVRSETTTISRCNKHRPKHKSEHHGGICESRDGDQRQAEHGESGEHPSGTRVAGREAVGEPTPEEISDFPPERRQPEYPPDFCLRESKDLLQIERREIENHADRQRAHAVGRDEAPESPLQRIRQRDSLRLRTL